MAEKDIAFLNSLDDDDDDEVPGKKAKGGVTPRVRWSEEEENVLIAAVLDREGELFGSMKGPGIKSVQEIRRGAWEQVTQYMNA